MDKRELLERYELLGEEADFLAAKPLYEQALAETVDVRLLRDYGYLLECHGRREVRQAVEQYRRALELDTDEEKVRYQLIGALAALFDTEEMVALYRERVAASPGEVREYRFLASAHLAAHEHEQARTVIEAGLELAPDDPMLITSRGEVKARTGDPEGALADWRRAFEIDSDAMGPLYSSAFLLEREGRLQEATEAW